MEQWEREYYTAQIVSGILYCTVGGRKLLYKSPSTENKFFAHQIYREVYEKALESGVYDDDKLMVYMLYHGLWSVEEQNKLDKMNEEVPELKIKLFELAMRSKEREIVRRALNDTRDAINELSEKRHSMDYQTAHGLAGSAKFKFLIGSSLYYLDGRPYWDSPLSWEKPDTVLNQVIDQVVAFKVSEKVLRELARNDPWRTLWVSGKHSGGIFGKPSAELTEHQKGIILYAQMYDNIQESPDYPGDEVAEDDDMLDGWLLIQKRKSDKEKGTQSVLSGITNEKIKNSEEIFIPVDSIDDAKKVYEANDIAGKIAFHQRMKQVKEEGEVKEIDLLETRQRLRMQAAQEYSRKIKGG